MKIACYNHYFSEYGLFKLNTCILYGNDKIGKVRHLTLGKAVATWNPWKFSLHEILIFIKLIFTKLSFAWLGTNYIGKKKIAGWYDNGNEYKLVCVYV